MQGRCEALMAIPAAKATVPKGLLRPVVHLVPHAKEATANPRAAPALLRGFPARKLPWRGTPLEPKWLEPKLAPQHYVGPWN